ncbi:MAG: C4-type zinc ribbon domain-containing protein [Candidatus Jordarchaeaceae archaeon]
MSYAFKLYRLQQIDTHLDQARTRLIEIETALSNNAALIETESRVKQTFEELNNSRKKLREIEREVDTLRTKLQQSESSLYSGKIRNPKELQDLHNEVISLKRHISLLEDRQLEAMINLEENEKKYQLAVENLEKIRKAYLERQAFLNDEKMKVLSILERQEHERSIISSGIPTPDLELYNQIRAQRNGVAVVQVSDNSCSACGSTLSSSVLQAARFANQVTRCTSCGRILYAG